MEERKTRLSNSNRFKLGLFAMNCSCGSIATTAPEQWKATWDENLDAAKLADAAGLEFLLPVARWHGYGGATDRQGTSMHQPDCSLKGQFVLGPRSGRKRSGTGPRPGTVVAQ